MGESAAELLSRLSEAVLGSPGDLDPAAREAIARRVADATTEIPDPLRIVVDKVAQHAYKVTDSDVEGLRRAGYSQDAIFEAIVSAAVSAGRLRFETATRAMGGST